MSTKIHGAEYPIEKIFCDDFVFSIPLYQRPYAWETEQAEALLDDLLGFLGEGNDQIDELNPYFLGSIVLIKAEGSTQAEVVDGQQRLTTLTILLSVLREVVPEDFAKALTEYLYEKGSLIKGTPNRYRLTLRERDAQFFQDHIQNEGGLAKLIELKNKPLSDSQSHIRDNALKLLQRLQELPQQRCVRLTQFVVMGCLLVVVYTPDMDSAYRIFSVLNDRGLDLSHTDILKSEIIGKISEAKQDQYNKLWEDTEDLLGRDTFRDLFSHIRMMYRKAKSQDTVLKEIRQYVKPTKQPTHFIDDVLYPAAQAYADIRDCAYESHQHAEAINTCFRYLNRVDNVDWLPPAISYLSRYSNQPAQLLWFFTQLDRLASCLMIRRANINERMRRYATLLTWIEDSKDLQSPESPLHLAQEECREVIQRLDGPLYLESKIRLYVLLRLDTYLSGGEAVYNFPRITVEHVLPQNPKPESEWFEWFDHEETRQRDVHRLGNLVLLSRYKNSSASNYDFATKKQKYFGGRDGVSPFVITTQALKEIEWTHDVVERRQKDLIGCLTKLWRLDEPAPVMATPT